MKPTIGRIVHYRVGGTDEDPTLAPATIVAVWGEDCANLVVSFDGSNHSNRREDIDNHYGANDSEAARCSGWRTSATQGSNAGQWRWPARA